MPTDVVALLLHVNPTSEFVPPSTAGLRKNPTRSNSVAFSARCQPNSIARRRRPPLLSVSSFGSSSNSRFLNSPVNFSPSRPHQAPSPMDMDATVSTLTALSIFASTVEHAAFRSVHGYRVIGRKDGKWVRWERWMERQFVLSLSVPPCREVAVPAASPRILMAEWRGRPVFREGRTVGTWRCIVAFDSVAAVAPSSPPPPVLSPLVNPQLQCLPNLYWDLQKVFQFEKVEKAPRLVRRNAKGQPIHSGEQGKTPDEADSSGSDSGGDTHSDKELAPPVQKQPRANRKHIDSITLAEIAQYFHLPIREASKTLKIGVSILKRKCRKYGIPRWPHRKIKSLDSLIQDLEYVLEEDPEEDGQQELLQMEEEKQAAAIKALTKRKKMLESEKEILQQKPALDLMTETKLFREDVFKRRYRAKSAAIDMEMETETE